MTTKTFCALDPNSMGPDLELTLSNLGVTCNVNAADKLRLVRGTIGKKDDSGKFYFEAAFWIATSINGAPTSAAGLISVGLANQVTQFANYVGGGTNNVGYLAGDGGIYYNDAQVAACDACNFSTGDKPQWIGVLYDTATNVVEFYLQGSLIATYTLSAGYVWFPAITVSGPAAYSVYGFINCGQRAFEFPPTDSDGWYSIGGASEVLYFTAVDDGPFVSASTDAVPNQVFKDLILDADSLSITRSSAVWPWTNSNDGVTFSSVSVRNEFGQVDASALTQDYRDSEVKIMTLFEGQTLDDAVVCGTAIFDRAKSNGESSASLSLKDKQVLLERPLQRKLYPPFADAAVANTPLPIVLGSCRNVDLGKNRYAPLTYRMSDTALTRVAQVYDMGAPLDPYSSPPQYTPTEDGGLVLATDPIGKLTADLSSIGGVPVNTGNPDILGGDGLFATWTGGHPTNWTFGGGSGNTLSQLGHSDDPNWPNYVARITTSTTWSPGHSKFGSNLSYDTSNLEPGRTLRLTIQLFRSLGSPVQIDDGRSYGLQLRTALNNDPAAAISPHGVPIQIPAFQPVTYTFEYTVPAGSNRKIYVIVSAADGPNNDGNSSGAAAVVFGQIKAELLGQFIVQPLDGITLTDYCREIFEVRGGLTADDWSQSDTEAIDAATGYKFGVNITDAITIIEAARLPLDSYCATLFTDADGVIRIRRLEDPALGTATGSYDLTNVEYGMGWEADYAPGLTNSAFARPNCSPYASADFVTDEVTVPPAVKTQFQRIGQFTVTSAVSLKQSFRSADQAPTILYRFDDFASAQVEIDRVDGFFSTARDGVPGFVTLNSFYAEDGDLIYFGDIKEAIYPRYGFDAGKNFVVIGSVHRPHAQSMEVTGWTPE